MREISNPSALPHPHHCDSDWQAGGLMVGSPDHARGASGALIWFNLFLTEIKNVIFNHFSFRPQSQRPGACSALKENPGRSRKTTARWSSTQSSTEGGGAAKVRPLTLLPGDWSVFSAHLPLHTLLLLLLPLPCCHVTRQRRQQRCRNSNPGAGEKKTRNCNQFYDRCKKMMLLQGIQSVLMTKCFQMWSIGCDKYEKIMIMINKIIFFVDSPLFSYCGDIFCVCVWRGDRRRTRACFDLTHCVHSVGF